MAAHRLLALDATAAGRARHLERPHGRARARARPAPRRFRRRGRDADLPPVHADRPGRCRQVAARGGLPRVRRRQRPGGARPRAVLRGGHHLLAARRDPHPARPRPGRGDPRRRRPTPSWRRGRCSSASPRSSRSCSCSTTCNGPKPPVLDLVEHVADWSRETPIFLLCVARPELLDVRPGWGGGKLNATSVLLEPLGDDGVGDARRRPAHRSRARRRSSATASSARQRATRSSSRSLHRWRARPGAASTCRRRSRRCCRRASTRSTSASGA